MQNDISMFVFLPDEVTTNTTLLEESLTAEFVQDLSMALQPAQVSLTLPVLRLSYSTDLLPLLGDLGEPQSVNRTRIKLPSLGFPSSFKHIIAHSSSPYHFEQPRIQTPPHP